MPFIVNWYIEKRVIFSKAYGILKLPEIHQVSDEIDQYIRAGNPPVHLIVDANELEKYPVNLYELRNAVRFASNPAMGWIIFSTQTDPMSRFLGTMVTYMSGADIRVVSSMEEGLRTLQKLDNTLHFSLENH